MWLIDLEKALQVLKNYIDPYKLVIKTVRPAYDGIVFEMSGNIKYKFLYMTNEIIQLQDWRVKHAQPPCRTEKLEESNFIFFKKNY